MGERTPHLDPDCRGVFFGLSAMHTRADLIRAVLEGVGYSLLDCYQILQEMGICPDDMTLCGGGANSPVWKRMLCDMFACPVSTVRLNEGAAQGAAILAAVGGGMFQSVQDACNVFVKKKRVLCRIYKTRSCTAISTRFTVRFIPRSARPFTHFPPYKTK